MHTPQPVPGADGHALGLYYLQDIDAANGEVAVKKLRCLLGFHRWVTAATEGERYLTCRDCGKYGGEPPSVWKY